MSATDTNNDGINDVKALYQLIMADLEPDLLLENIGTLKEKYKTESKEDRAVRSKRYAVALQECFRRMHLVIDQMKQDMKTFKKVITDTLLQKEGHERDDHVKHIEHSLDQL